MAELDRGIEGQRFSTAGGPFLQLVRRLHLTWVDGSPMAWVLVAITWAPLCAGALLRMAFGLRPAPILFDLSVHTRLLIVIPLVIQAERLLDRRCADAIGQLYRGKFADQASIDRITHRAARLRDSWRVELAIFALALVAGQVVFWGHVGSTGLFSGVSGAGSTSFAHLWYATIAFPIAQFLIVRWLWHWVVWSYVVVRLSRLRLATLATHPDHAGGIGFLATPISAFSGFVIAFAAMIASAWGTKILDGHATLQTYVPSFVAFLALAVVVACAPLVAFAGMLYRLRHRDIARYNGLALDYVRDFDRRWIEDRTEPLLGTPDIQSMADLANTYDQLVKIRLVPIGPRAIAGLWTAAVIPMIPLILTAMPLTELMRHVGGALLGGLPG